jgi:uncharacterized membrane protein (UPF0127 family)
MALRLKWLVVAAVSFFFITSPAWSEEAPQFSKIKVSISQGKIKKKLEVELAQSPTQQAYGLMKRTKMPANAGMLFVFDQERVLQFWMKNTLIDLDIAYIDKNKKIIDIQQMKAVTSILETNPPTYPSKLPAQFALEMNSGWFKKNKIKEGAQLSF